LDLFFIGAVGNARIIVLGRLWGFKKKVLFFNLGSTDSAEKASPRLMIPLVSDVFISNFYFRKYKSLLQTLFCWTISYSSWFLVKTLVKDSAAVGRAIFLQGRLAHFETTLRTLAAYLQLILPKN
jgi:hypothetical protein